MKLFAVAYINFFDNEMNIEFHRGTDWFEAVMKHSKIRYIESEDLETAKHRAFDQDYMFDVKEVPT